MSPDRGSGTGLRVPCREIGENLVVREHLVERLNQTETLPILAYRRAFLEFDLGGGAAVATISFLLLASIILIYLRFFPIDEAKQGR